MLISRNASLYMYGSKRDSAVGLYIVHLTDSSRSRVSRKQPCLTQVKDGSYWGLSGQSIMSPVTTHDLRCYRSPVAPQNHQVPEPLAVQTGPFRDRITYTNPLSVPLSDIHLSICL